SHIDDEEVEEEMLKYVGKAGHRKITDILLFIIPGLVERNVLNINNPVIHVHISGDGRNVGRKIKHVIVTCYILDDILNIHKAEFHYTIILYSGNENYEILKKVMEPMINELHNLVTNGLDSSGTRWMIIPHFSSDWKFLSIILGFNAANANYFCPWCLCSKKEIGNKNKVYVIEKTIEQLQITKPPPGHFKAPLLYMIPLEHYLPDLLHIMLRIWDRMWSLVVQELKSENRYDDNIRAIIHSEMQRISVKFHFWQDHDTQSWNNTSLMGDDKETVLHFYALYIAMKQQNFDLGLFSIQAKSWLDLFLTPSQGEPNSRNFKRGLYWPRDVTPEEESHSSFRKTMKDGGNGAERKSAIFEILCYENRSIYFTQNPTTALVSRPQRLHIKNNW
ncbi:35782_t:CDS:2, partial [Gigaspora margarita]